MTRKLCAGVTLLVGQALAFGDSSADEVTRQVVKHFDFNEVPRGNYDELPMHWLRLDGPGLPHYSTGRIDRTVGRGDATSLRLDLQGGNVALEYQMDDIRVVPQSDYRVEVFVRTQDLREARAFISTYLVDRAGRRISGTSTVSDLAPSLSNAPPGLAREAAGSASDDEWRLCQIDVLDTPAEAFAMRVQAWIAQDQAWRMPRPGAVDPINREDVRGRAWFDDLTVYRLPQVRLECSAPAGVCVAGTPVMLQLTVQNPGPASLHSRVRVQDDKGRQVADFEGRTIGLEVASQSFELPQLPIGAYTAMIELHGNGAPVLTRWLALLVVSDLPDDGLRHSSFALDLGRISSDGARELPDAVRALFAGAVRIGVPMLSEVTQPHEIRYFDEIRDLIAAFTSRQVEVCGVMLGPVDEQHRTALTARQLASPPSKIPERFGPVLARLGGILPTWQLGDDATELKGPDWDPAVVAALAREFEKFMTFPRFVQPRRLLDARHEALILREVLQEYPATQPAAPSSAPAPQISGMIARSGVPPHVEAISHLVPSELSGRALAWELAFLTSEEGNRSKPRLPFGPIEPSDWITFGRPLATKPAETVLADLAYKIILSRAIGVERAYFPAPLRSSTENGSHAWHATEAFPIMRTLFWHLGGKSARRVLKLPNESIAILFSGMDQDCIVAWSWAAGPAQMCREFDLGDAVQAWDLWGRPVPVERFNSRTGFPISPMPILLLGVDRPLLEFQAEVAVSPRTFTPEDADPKLTVELWNPYDHPLSGTVVVDAPDNWVVTPQEFDFLLVAGGSDSRVLSVRLPRVAEAGHESLSLTLALRSPDVRELRLDVPVEIGLSQLRVNASALWRGSDLVILHTLRNESAAVVHFSGFCQPPAHRRQSGAFYNVSPGDARVQEYVFRGAERLAGMELVVGIEELEGRRRLTQRVVVPPRSAASRPSADG